MRGAERQPQNTRDRVADAHRAIVTGSSNFSSAPVADGGHVREAFRGSCDSPYNETPIVRAPIELGNSLFLWEGRGGKHR